MFAYPATLKADRKAGGYVVTFRDIPEAITQGDSITDAMKNGLDALETALQFYFDDRRAVPLPSAPKRSERLIVVPFSEALKIMLLNEMVRQEVRPSELAKRMHTNKQEVNRLTTLAHTTKVDRIADALQALGKQFKIGVVAA